MDKANTYVIMDAEYNEVLCDDEQWLTYPSLTIASTVAKTYNGKVVTIEVAEHIIGLQHQIEELKDIVANGIHLEEP